MQKGRGIRFHFEYACAQGALPYSSDLLPQEHGLIPDSEKRRFHALGLNRPIALLSIALKQRFCLIDAICGDLTFEEGGTPLERNMVLASPDPVTADTYCASLLGLSPDSIGYLPLAAQMGVGKPFGPDSELIELHKEDKPLKGPKADVGAAKALVSSVDEDMACSACYSGLIFCLRQIRGLKGRIAIGQGFKGKTGNLGFGDCTRGFAKCIKGCPPNPADAAAFLRSL
jgi:hypothetical protein